MYRHEWEKERESEREKEIEIQRATKNKKWKQQHDCNICNSLHKTTKLSTVQRTRTATDFNLN